MTATELAQYGVTQTHNSASAAIMWLAIFTAAAFALYFAFGWFVCKVTDYELKRKIKREAVRP